MKQGTAISNAFKALFQVTTEEDRQELREAFISGGIPAPELYGRIQSRPGAERLNKAMEKVTKFPLWQELKEAFFFKDGPRFIALSLRIRDGGQK